MRRLPRSTAAAVRAAARFPTWASLVDALVRAALHAGAARIDVLVDLDAWTLSCRDTGDGAAVLHAAADAGLAHLALLDADVRLATGRHTRLERGDQVLYAGPTPAPRTHAPTNGVTLRDVFAGIPVRRRVLAAARRAELRRVRECVRALALSHPDTHLTLSTRAARLVRAPRAPTLRARAERVCGPPFAHARTLAADRVFGAWRVTLHGVVGTPCAAPVHQHIAINGVPVPRTPGLAAAYALREARHADVLPWQDSRAYERIALGDRSLHTHAARCLGAHGAHEHAAFVLNVCVARASTPQLERAPRDWYALLGALLAHDAPPAGPTRRARTSRYFAPHAPRTPRAAVPRAAADDGADAEPVPVPPRAALRDARVVAQVDRKYIVCAAGDVVLLVDQHAADERVRLEALVAQYVAACLEARAAGTEAHRCACAPLVVPLAELPLTPAHVDVVRFWGFGVRRTTHWTVDAVPRALERLAHDASLLRRVLDAFAHQPVDEMPMWLRTLAPGSASAHMAALRHWPPLVTHLLATQACHRAIRTCDAYPGFHHALTSEQCTRLVSQLAETAFPYQCAHGRPSVVAVRVHMPLAPRALNWAWLGAEAAP